MREIKKEDISNIPENFVNVPEIKKENFKKENIFPEIKQEKYSKNVSAKNFP